MLSTSLKKVSTSIGIVLALECRWSGKLKVPVYFDVGFDDWLYGHVPQREEKFGFYKVHYLKKRNVFKQF